MNILICVGCYQSPTLALEHFNYKKDDIVMLTDDARRPEEQPTRANILRAMEWLVRFASPNDSLFFHCKQLYNCISPIC